MPEAQRDHFKRILHTLEDDLINFDASDAMSRESVRRSLSDIVWVLRVDIRWPLLGTDPGPLVRLRERDGRLNAEESGQLFLQFWRAKDAAMAGQGAWRDLTQKIIAAHSEPNVHQSTTKEDFDRMLVDWSILYLQQGFDDDAGQQGQSRNNEQLKRAG